jgi:hypothetical protein
MSDTTAFLGGAAVAGLAALVLLRGGVNAGSPMVATVPQPLPAVPLPSPLLSPAVTASPVAGSDQQNNDVQKFAIDQLTKAVEQQRTESEKLREQVQRQQSVIDALATQARLTSSNFQPRPATPSAPLAEQPNSMVNSMMWALGGVALSLGGGIVLVGMFVTLSKQQGRSARSVEIVQPLEDYTYISPDRRYIQTLPPRRVMSKRGKSMDDM